MCACLQAIFCCVPSPALLHIGCIGSHMGAVDCCFVQLTGPAPSSPQGVMALQSDDDIAHAVGSMRQLSAVLAQQGLLAPLELDLGGLSHFRNQVPLPASDCLPLPLGPALRT